ncbi:MAG TPA: MCE family protein [Pseudonocardiaceae bacterium]|jgi:phospholipid/cholesterol/gamma-HCH transport system substrate-binding protein|nr:MCE family protein [Pseudonocardiaceae bacterium]
MTRWRKPALGAGVLGVALLTAGCGSGGFGGIYDIPLPGGADLGSHPYQVTAQFGDVLDLVPQAAVKVNDVAVGRVTRISLPVHGWTANVTMEVNGDVHLPANATASLEQSSLLGEKFVELAAPANQTPAGTLADRAVIPIARTSRNPEVEEVLGALSMLLNGGGIAQLRTISRQLNSALTGNEPQIRAALTNLNDVVANLDAHKQDITRALDGIDRLSATISARDKEVGTVLDDLTPGLKVLDQQRGQLVDMLGSLNTLSDVAVTTVNDSRDDLVADLRSLQPTLRQLANAGQALPRALQVLLTYPFTDAVLADIKGDYLNVYASIVAPSGTQVAPPITSIAPNTTSAPLAGLPQVTVPAQGGGS